MGGTKWVLAGFRAKSGTSAVAWDYLENRDIVKVVCLRSLAVERCTEKMAKEQEVLATVRERNSFVIERRLLCLTAQEPKGQSQGNKRSVKRNGGIVD